MKNFIKKKGKMLLLGLLSVSVIASVTTAGIVAFATGEDNITLSADIAEEYARNATFVIPEAELETSGGKKELNSTLTFPSGDVFSGDTAYLTEIGEYTVRYFDDNGFEKEYTFDVVNKMSGLFSFGSGITAQNDAAVPDYMPNFAGDVKQGVKFTMEIGGTNYITYNNVIDLNECGFSKFDAQNNSTSFVEFLFTPDEQGVKEMNCFQIILTDIYDPTNYLTIEMLAGDVQSVYPGSVYTKAAPKGMYDPIGLMTGSEAYVAGRTIAVPMNGQEQSDLKAHYSAKLFYDVDDNEFWGGGCYYRRVAGTNPDGSFIVAQGVENKAIMVDFDNPDVVGLNNIWSGFTTGEVYLSFKVKDFALSKASFTVLSIGGKTFEDNYDEVGEIKYIPKTNQFDLNTDYLVAGEGHAFKPFDMLVVSENYGILDDVSVAVYYGENKATSVPLQNGQFEVLQAGKYILEYTAQSPLGKHVYEIVLTAKSSYDAKDALSYTINDKLVNTAKYGETIYLFEGITSGGIGSTTVSYEVLCGGETVEIDYSGTVPKFTIDSVADYTITITYSDEIGGKIVVEHTIAASYDNVPRFEMPILPDTYIKGNTYFFQIPDTFYWSENGSSEVKMEVLVGGVDVSSGYKVTGDFTLTYKASLKNNPSVVKEETVSCKAVEAVDGENYFTSFFTQKNTSLASEEQGIALTTSSIDNAVKFNRVIKDELLSTALYVDGSNSNFTGIEIVLTDAKNKEQEYVCSFREMVVVGKTYIGFYNGDEFVMFVDTAFDGSSSTPFGINYDKKNFSLTGYLTESYGKMGYYTNGEKFAGFDSGYVFVEYRILDVENESKLFIKSISNQVFKSNIVTDKIQPQVVYSENLPTSSIGVFGDKFITPSAISFDVLNDVEACSLKVYAPGVAAPIYEGDATSAYELELNKMGNYRLVYECKDGKNNSYKFTYYVLCVEDEKPVITLSNVVTEAKVGQAYTLATATMTDNVEVTGSCKYILDEYRVILVDGDTYTFTKNGTYTIVYYAVDDCDNYVMESYTVEVK